MGWPADAAAALERRDEQALELIAAKTSDGRSTMTGLIALGEYSASKHGVIELSCRLSAEATAPDHPAHEYFVQRYAYTGSQVTRLQATRRRWSLPSGHGTCKRGERHPRDDGWTSSAVATGPLPVDTAAERSTYLSGILDFEP
jgi:hypothetical protein